LFIIPVLDIKDGLVVHARMGMRDRYKPIETPLSPEPTLGRVASGLRRVHPFRSFYVADLDAIERRAPPIAAAEALSQLQPPADVWLDAGCFTVAEVERVLGAERTSCVLGSESQTGPEVLRLLNAHARLILSLDFREDAFMGPPAVLEGPALWPARVIVMTLGRVGARLGPDFDRLRAIKAVAGSRQVIAAGGVRDADDLRRLDAMGIAGALVATALHNGSLRGDEIAALASNTGEP
jgi:phosphoribosylformimino-5-aminoimidazole carboxamide ribotide isomerase